MFRTRVSGARLDGVRRSANYRACSVSVQASVGREHGREPAAVPSTRRRLLWAVSGTAAVLVGGEAQALTSNPLEYKKELRNKRRKIPESEYTDSPDGFKYYDLVVGDGPEASVGDRVVVHYDLKFRNVTFMTSRQGMGVTGGTPFGWDVGQPAGSAGSTLKGLDVAVRGMRVGGQRRAILPPELAYGSKGIGEIPPNSTLMLDIELLSVKNSPFGYRVKVVEG